MMAFAGTASAAPPAPEPCFGVAVGPSVVFVMVGSAYNGVWVSDSGAGFTGPTSCRLACGYDTICVDCRVPGDCWAS